MDICFTFLEVSVGFVYLIRLYIYKDKILKTERLTNLKITELLGG